MEFTKAEINAVEVAVEEQKSADARVLESLELALVGGGMGDVVFA